MKKLRTNTENTSEINWNAPILNHRERSNSRQESRSAVEREETFEIMWNATDKAIKWLKFDVRQSWTGITCHQRKPSCIVCCSNPWDDDSLLHSLPTPTLHVMNLQVPFFHRRAT
jgi:hypothetical protein